MYRKFAFFLGNHFLNSRSTERSSKTPRASRWARAPERDANLQVKAEQRRGVFEMPNRLMAIQALIPAKNLNLVYIFFSKYVQYKTSKKMQQYSPQLPCCLLGVHTGFAMPNTVKYHKQAAESDKIYLKSLLNNAFPKSRGVPFTNPIGDFHSQIP